MLKRISDDVMNQCETHNNNLMSIKSLQNDICVIHFKVGNHLGLNKTKKDLYEEACRINLKYNQQ